MDYGVLGETIAALTEGETDPITLMATVVCEVHFSDARFDWTGFYRVVAPEVMKVGPYQGGMAVLLSLSLAASVGQRLGVARPNLCRT